MLTLADVASSRSEAKVLGSMHYLTGSPCANGHVALRWTRNGECTACAEIRRSDPERRVKARDTYAKTYKERRASILAKQRDDRVKNPEMFNRRQARYCEKNPEKRKESQNNYYARNRARYLELNRLRETGVHQATPAWADRAEIEKIYAIARYLQESTGVEYHVDHVIPLKGVNRAGEHVVCGLHVHHNLAPVPAPENRRKSNRFWGDYADVS